MIKAVRGMNDWLPPKMHMWAHLFQKVAPILKSYGYSQIRTPILESTDLFARAVGEVSDIVEKEMYSFSDRHGDSLSLRPEGTASCVRMGLEHGLFYHQVQKWWYEGPMYRHERPQKGRYREFFQLGVEAFGFAQPEVDAELIALSYRLLDTLGLSQGLSLQINTIGTPASRAAYRESLIAYFSKYEQNLDADSQRRLHRNPFRILDSKDPRTQDLVKEAPLFSEYLDAESVAHFETLQLLLQRMGIGYTINPYLVRGLDYYHRTVFEWLTDRLGAQAAVCAGGRYDGLVELMGGQPTPAVGFAMGIERLLELMEMQNQSTTESIDFYLIGLSPEARLFLSVQVEKWRRANPGAIWLFHAQEQALKAQLKKANAAGAKWTVISGLENEQDPSQLTVKKMSTGEQLTMTAHQLPSLWEGEHA